jgi:hypothetical protein
MYTRYLYRNGRECGDRHGHEHSGLDGRLKRFGVMVGGRTQLARTANVGLKLAYALCSTST